MHTSKILACEICEKTFSTNKNIVKHISIIHGEEKKFESNVCTKTFGQKQELEIHIETNHKIKEQNCKFCGKDFARSETMIVHIKNTHKGTQKNNFKCDSCRKCFT